jgi:ATP-binding cassette subfamily F protein 3
VIVSHDKYFLNRMVTKIVELYQKQLHIYNGNYDFYEKEKLERIALQQRAYENQQDYIRQNERLVERFRAKASKAAMAQSLIKKLEKLDRIEEPELERPNIKINFRLDKVPGKVLVELKDVTKAFDENVIVKNSSAEVNRGDKIALIGANGKGKSTLLRMIAGTEPFNGERKWGHNVEESFYAQHQLEALNLNHTVIEEMMECGSQKTELELRTLLGCFLFSGDDVEKKIKVLSGGEKARVALAKTIISKANFLLLDEPTNHLDMHSCELLAEALNKYEGSYVLVSHDRYFISQTANKIWEIVDHEIKEFKGGYEEWVEWKKRMESSVESRESGARRQEPDTPKKPEIADKPISTSGAIDKQLKKELQKQQRIFQQLEEKISKLNDEKQKLEAALADPSTYANKEKFLQIEASYKNISAELEQFNKQYEQVFEKIAELESNN